MTENTKDKKTQEKNEDAEKGSKKQKAFLPPLDFSSLVLPFYTQALINLGMDDDPEHPEKENLEHAKRLIDILDLLKEKTKGNLKPEEEAILESCLHQLKLGYMNKAKIINL